MPFPSKLPVILLAAFLLWACASQEKAGQLPYYNSPEFTPKFLESDQEIDQKITHTIAPFSFTDQRGQAVSDTTIEGKIHVANFIFTSCGSICPVLTKHMKLVQDEFKNTPDVVLLSYSVTPWIDDVARLRQFADKNGVSSPKWHLLTGSKSDIYTLARQSYFAEEDLGYTKDSTQFLHTEHVLLVDKNKRIRGIYNGTLQLEAEQLIKDIKVLQIE